MIETRNGSGLVLKQHVWGTGYIDELVQVAVNSDPVTGGEVRRRIDWRFREADKGSLLNLRAGKGYG